MISCHYSSCLSIFSSQHIITWSCQSLSSVCQSQEDGLKQGTSAGMQNCSHILSKLSYTNHTYSGKWANILSISKISKRFLPMSLKTNWCGKEIFLIKIWYSWTHNQVKSLFLIKRVYGTRIPSSILFCTEILSMKFLNFLFN